MTLSEAFVLKEYQYLQNCVWEAKWYPMDIMQLSKIFDLFGIERERLGGAIWHLEHL